MPTLQLACQLILLCSWCQVNKTKAMLFANTPILEQLPSQLLSYPLALRGVEETIDAITVAYCFSLCKRNNGSNPEQYLSKCKASLRVEKVCVFCHLSLSPTTAHPLLL